MQIPFIPFARRLAVAAVVPVAATLALASGALAQTPSPSPSPSPSPTPSAPVYLPPHIGYDCTKTEATFYISVTDPKGDSYALKGHGTVVFVFGETPAGTTTWKWQLGGPTTQDVATFTTAHMPDVNGVWTIALLDTDHEPLFVSQGELKDCVAHTPSPSPSARPTIQPTPTPTPTSKPGLPKTGVHAG